MKEYNYNLFDSYDNESKEVNVTAINLEEFTTKHLKKYIKNVGKNELSLFFVCYRADMEEEDNLERLTHSIKVLKESYNNYVSDIYYDNEYLSIQYTIKAYIKYSNRILNNYIKNRL